VQAIRIHDKAKDVLAFDLSEVLAALGPRGLNAYWTVGGVSADDGNFDATGDGAGALEGLAKSGERIIGMRLAKIAKAVRQVIWGEFKDYRDKLSDTPTVVVVAFDSSWWEVRSDEKTLLERVAKAFEDVEWL
jgi:hypothetical protein